MLPVYTPLFPPSPVLGWEVVEGKQSFAVPGQVFDCLVVLGAVGLDEEVEGFLGIITGLGHPDVLEVRLGFALDALGQLVEHVSDLVHPTSLLAGLAVDPAQGLPEAERDTAQAAPT